MVVFMTILNLTQQRWTSDALETTMDEVEKDN